MKKVLYSLLVLCGTLGLWSCEETSQDTSKVTYFVDLQMSGDAVMTWPQGTAFIEPGYSAELNGEDVTSDVKVTGTVNVNTPGMYKLQYDAVNADGFAKSLTRTVYVYDVTSSAMESGVYTLDKTSYRDNAGAIASYGASYQIVIYQIEPGIFFVSDFLAGWYDKRSAYGPGYCVEGQMTLKSDNTLELGDNKMVGGWADSLDGMTDGEYDPATKTITMVSGYAKMLFYITLTK